MSGKFIPNRIFRGKIVETLRDAKAGLNSEKIGAEIAVDWNPKEHREWLQGLLKNLVRDMMIQKRGARYMLSE